MADKCMFRILSSHKQVLMECARARVNVCNQTVTRYPGPLGTRYAFLENYPGCLRKVLKEKRGVGIDALAYVLWSLSMEFNECWQSVRVLECQ